MKTLHLLAKFPLFVTLVGSLHTVPAIAQTSVESPSTPQAETAWQTITSEEGGYSIQMPGQPIAETVPLRIRNATLDWQVNHLDIPATEQGDRPEDFVVAYTDLPATYTADKTPEAILEDAAGIIQANPRLGEVFTRQRAIEVEGFPSRLLVGNRNGSYQVALLTLIGDRLYLSAASSQERDDLTQFFNSLDFVADAPAASATEQDVRSTTRTEEPVTSAPSVQTQSSSPTPQPTVAPATPVRALW